MQLVEAGDGVGQPLAVDVVAACDDEIRGNGVRGGEGQRKGGGQRAQAAVLPAAMRAAVVRIERGEAMAPVLAELSAALLDGGFASVD